MVFTCLKIGFSKMWANKRIVLIFYLANLLFGILLLVPFFSSVRSFVGNSYLGESLAGPFDINFFIELVHHNEIFIPGIFWALLIVGILYWLSSLFLSGGALAILALDEKFTGPEFWSSAANLFGRFFRLSLLGAILLTAMLLAPGLISILEGIVFGDDPYQYISYWSSWVMITLRLIAILAFFLIFDIARIYTVLMDERKMTTALLEGVRFVVRNFRRAFTLSVAIFLIGIVVALIYNPLSDLLAAPNAVIILFLLILQQLFLFFRMMLRLSLYAGEMNLYMNLSDKVAPPMAPVMDEIVISGGKQNIEDLLDKDVE